MWPHTFYWCILYCGHVLVFDQNATSSIWKQETWGQVVSSQHLMLQVICCVYCTFSSIVHALTCTRVRVYLFKKGRGWFYIMLITIIDKMRRAISFHLLCWTQSCLFISSPGWVKMAQQFVQTKIKGDKVVLFIKPTCPYCTMAKDVLSKYKFKPGHLEYIDISGRSDMKSMQDYFLELTGERTVNTMLLCHTWGFTTWKQWSLHNCVLWNDV